MFRFGDGSKVIVGDGFASDLEDVFARRELDSRFKRYDFYPGQILFGPSKYIEILAFVKNQTFFCLI